MLVCTAAAAATVVVAGEGGGIEKGDIGVLHDIIHPAQP